MEREAAFQNDHEELSAQLLFGILITELHFSVNSK